MHPLCSCDSSYKERGANIILFVEPMLQHYLALPARWPPLHSLPLPAFRPSLCSVAVAVCSASGKLSREELLSFDEGRG